MAERPAASPAAGTRELARMISAVENESPGYEAILEALRPDEAVPVIGFTGPPGAGKSTLLDATVAALLAGSHGPLRGGVAVVGVDPSSPFTSGALLADRLRMSRHFSDPRVFIRSLATRGALGGLSYKTVEVVDVLRAHGFGIVLVETVGAGQTEMEIASLADVTVLVLVPESGDTIQAAKAGLMEAADVVVINKADREGADRMEAHVREAFALDPGPPRDVPVLRTVATESKGIDELLGAVLAKHGRMSEAKKEQLLLDKAWRLVRDYLLTASDREALKEALLARRGRPGFNLYSFARAFARRNRAQAG
jgi:LAO/AO transport system kinase